MTSTVDDVGVHAMQVVPRHEIDLEFAGRQVTDLKRSVGRALDRVERFPQRTNELTSTAWMRFGYLAALDPKCDHGPTWEAFTLAMQAGSSVFASAMAPPSTVVDCRLDVEVKRIPASGSQYWTGPNTWLRAFWLAMTCRERERTDMLCAVPVEFLRTSEPGFDPYVYDWVGALQMFWRGEPGHAQRFHLALEGTDPAAVTVATHEFTYLLSFPPMKMFSYLLTGEHERFAEALYEAVDLHRTYWTKDDYRRRQPEGFVALGPLAVACLAREMGVPFEIDTPYLPAGLLQAGWVGEFRT
jgi:hypothetical protein